MTDPAMGVKIVPANKASWDDLEAVLGGASCHGGRCYCQRFKLGRNAWPGDDLDRAPLRVRGIERVALHADLTMLAMLATALARARPVPLAA